MKIDNRKQCPGRRPSYRTGEAVKSTNLYKELNEYQQAGISLWLNGRPSTSFGIASYVREETDYMRDYHMNQANEVCGIGFDRIRKDNSRKRRSPEARNLKKL